MNMKIAVAALFQMMTVKALDEVCANGQSRSTYCCEWETNNDNSWPLMHYQEDGIGSESACINMVADSDECTFEGTTNPIAVFVQLDNNQNSNLCACYDTATLGKFGTTTFGYKSCVLDGVERRSTLSIDESSASKVAASFMTLAALAAASMH